MHICGFERNVYKNYILGGLFTFTKSVESGEGDGVVMAQSLLNRRLNVGDCQFPNILTARI